MTLNHSELTNSIIQREAECIGRRMGFKIVKASYSFICMKYTWGFVIIADSYYYSCQIEKGDLRLCLDDFSEKYIQKGLQEITNSLTQYDDAGQII